MTFEEYKQQARAAAQADYDAQAAINKAATDKYISETNAAYDASAKVVQDKIGGQIDAIPGQYKPKYDTNAINEVITRRKLGERMANLGMSNSGYSRSQDTAILLNKNNADAAIGRQQQAEVAALRQQLNEYIASVEEQKAQTAAQAQYNLSEKNQALYTSLMTAADEQAASRYNAQVQAADSRGTGSSGGSNNNNADFELFTFANKDVDNGTATFYKDGKEYTFAIGVNPYTGTKNTDIAYGTFGNGYQPNNVGENLPLTRTGITDVVNGRTQNVWQDPTGQKWIWDGSINEYRKYVE